MERALPGANNDEVSSLRGYMLAKQEEANAWQRALVQVVGERAARGGTAVGDQATV